MRIKQKGFTFVELMVVITVASIMFAVATVSYQNVTKNSRDSRRKTDMESIRQAMELYRSYVGTYPTGIYLTCGSYEGICSGNQTYMSKTPVDPKDGSDYVYNSVGGTTYTLTTNKMENTDNPYTVIQP